MSVIQVKKEDHIAILSVVRPEALNALSREIVDEMGEAIDAIEKDQDIYCLIFHSEKNFAAGADIKKMADCDEDGAKAFCFSPVYDRIAELPIPTIAAIEGYALGGGMELALCADIRIAGESAKMGFPEVTLGIFPGAGGTIRAPKLIGPAFAKELICSFGRSEEAGCEDCQKRSGGCTHGQGRDHQGSGNGRCQSRYRLRSTAMGEAFHDLRPKGRHACFHGKEKTAI